MNTSVAPVVPITYRLAVAALNWKRSSSPGWGLPWPGPTTAFFRPGDETLRQRGRFCQGWRVFEPPAGRGLDRFCSATMLTKPGRKEAFYLTRRGDAAVRRGG